MGSAGVSPAGPGILPGSLPVARVGRLGPGTPTCPPNGGVTDEALVTREEKCVLAPHPVHHIRKAYQGAPGGQALPDFPTSAPRSSKAFHRT
jgi:hypothetical protein